MTRRFFVTGDLVVFFSVTGDSAVFFFATGDSMKCMLLVTRPFFSLLVARLFVVTGDSAFSLLVTRLFFVTGDSVLFRYW